MKDLLPIGSVVYLKNIDRPMMICGFCPTGPARPGYVYDYSGFPYPMGYMDPTKIFQFDNQDIEKIVAMGYQDRETFVYMTALEEKIDDIKAETAAQFADTPADENQGE